MTPPPILALDVDGVLVEGLPRYRWDAQIEVDLGIAPNRLQKEFFQPHWRDIVLGYAPVEIHLKTFLEEYPSKVSVQEFLSYWHSNDAHLRDDVVDAALRWKKRYGGKLALTTNQDRARLAFLKEMPRIGKHFQTMVVSCEVGVAKPELAYFEAADLLLNRGPEQTVIFLDDLSVNVSAATAHGWVAHQVIKIDLAADIIDAL